MFRGLVLVLHLIVAVYLVATVGRAPVFREEPGVSTGQS